MIIEEVKKELTGHIIPFWNKLRDDEILRLYEL